MPDVFISYSRQNEEFVHKLHDALNERGKDAWVDWDDIPLTSEWLRAIYEGIESSDNFVFVISPDSVVSKVCLKELGHAVEQRKRLVPVLHKKVDDAAMPEALAPVNWIPVRDEDDLAADVDTLVEALDTDLEWVTAHTRLLGRALEWERNGRDSSFLLRGSDLEEAERRLASRPTDREPKPTQLQGEYVYLARRAATRRQRIVVGAAFTGLAVAACLAVLAWVQRNTAVEQQHRAERAARLAHSRELAAQAVAELRIDPEQSLVLAATAATTAGTNEARDALRQALSGSHLRWMIEADAPVVDTALDPKGRLVAAALEDGSVRIWNATTRSPVSTLRRRGTLSSVGFDADGGRLLAAGEGGVTLWSTAPGSQQPIVTFDQAGGPLAAAFSPDGEHVATADIDGVVRLWRARTGELGDQLILPGAPFPVTALAFSPDGSRIVAASGSRTAIWNLRGKSPPAIRSHEKDVWAVAFSPDGLHVATGDVDGVARVWTVRTGESLELNGHEGAITSLSFSPDGASLVTGSEDETARIWDARTGKSLAELRGHGGLVLGAMFPPSGRFVVTGGDDGTIRGWSVTSDPVRTELHASDERTLRDVGFHPNGEQLVTASEDLTARVWNATTGHELHVLQHGQADDSWVESASFSQDGRLVVTAGDDGIAKVWESSSGALLATVGARGGAALYDAAFSPDGQIVAVAGSGPAVQLWRWRQGWPMMRFEGSADRVDGVAFSPSGNLVAAAGSDGTVRIRRVRDGTLAVVLHGRGQLTSVAFSPSGKLVVAGSSSGAVWVWDVRTGEPITVVAGHSDTVTDVGFSSDGRYLVTAGHDGVANVLTVPRGRIVTSVRTPAPFLEGAAFAPTGRAVAVAGADGRATVFECSGCRPLSSLVCLAAGRVTPGVRASEQGVFGRCD